mgnify:CR=1 FL=1
MGKKLSLGIFGLFFSALIHLYAENDFDSTITPFLETHCFKCHGPEKQKADRRYDQLLHPIQNDDDLLLFQDILDTLYYLHSLQHYHINPFLYQHHIS